MTKPEPDTARRSLAARLGLGWHFGAVLAAAVAGGALAHLAGLPAAWLCGSAIAVAVLALLRQDARFPPWLQSPLLAILGAAMGAAVRPGMFAAFDRPVMSLLALLVTIVGVTLAGYVIYRRIAHWSPETALLASVPGALAYCIALAVSSRDADVPRVAMAQTLRVIVLVAVIPLLVQAGQELPPPPAAPDLPPDPAELAALALACLAGLWVAVRLRLPAAPLLGPFLVSLALHLTGVLSVHLPVALTVPAYLLLGANIGARFGRCEPALLARSIVPTLFSIAAGIAISVAVASVVSALTGLPMVQAFLAFAPGGIDSMAVLALALHLDAAFVVLHQVARFLLLTLLLPLGTRFATWRAGAVPGE